MSCAPFSACPTPTFAMRSGSSIAASASPSVSSWKRGVSCAAVIALAAACSPPPPPEDPRQPANAEGAPLERVQTALADALTPPVVAVREGIQRVVPPPAPPAPVLPLVDPRAVQLIVHYEVTSPAFYRARLQGVIWPSGASGATWGVGYDGGHQTRAVIERDWQRHQHRDLLSTTAGITGARARDLVRALGEVVTAYAYAFEVFEQSSLPVYHGRARRAFGASDFDRLSPAAAGALVSVVYNRGGGMAGDTRREMRTIRDDCMPSVDVHCIAREIRAMCRIWRGTPNDAGLCRRRNDEAALALEDSA